jgi:hypothetical protein
VGSRAGLWLVGLLSVALFGLGVWIGFGSPSAPLAGGMVSGFGAVLCPIFLSLRR